MKAWGVTDDIDVVLDYVSNTPSKEVSQDMIANMLLGIKHLYDLRFQKLFDDFENLIHNKVI